MVDTESGQVLETLGQVAGQVGASPSFWALFIGAEWVVQIIMVGLVMTSIMTWAVIIAKVWELKTLRNKLKRFESFFWQQSNLNMNENDIELIPTVCQKLLQNIHHERDIFEKSHSKSKDDGVPLSVHETRLEKAFGTYIRQEVEQRSYYLNFLATVGSSALFVGLFGTVWGIIHSFQSIAASKNTSLAVVAPGIAEALLATALGLIVAIPAVVAYNKLSSMVNSYADQIETFADRLILVFGKQVLTKGG